MQARRSETKAALDEGSPLGFDRDGRALIYPRVHGLVFDPKDGILKRLSLNLGQRFRRLASVYKLEDGGEGDVLGALEDPLVLVLCGLPGGSLQLVGHRVVPRDLVLTVLCMRLVGSTQLGVVALLQLVGRAQLLLALLLRLVRSAQLLA